MAAMAAIEVSELVVRRGGRAILQDLDLAVAAGAVTGLLGPSGSGKTTLMRCVVGLQRFAGRVRVLGRPAGAAALRREIGYVTQTPSIYGDLTAAGNVGHHATLHGRPRGAAARALGQVGLDVHAGSLVATMSGGERGRVSLACALVAEPALLVLDEPTVGLDPVLRRDLWTLFRELTATGVTVLVSSHAMDEADRCDDLVLLRDGSVIATGPPAALRSDTGTADIESAFLRLVEVPR